jgi:transposase, IS30 family
MHLDGASVFAIARALHVHVSTIYRELKRGEYIHLNSDFTTEKRYSPDIAQARYAENLKAKGAGLKIGSDRQFAAYVERKIADERYSPAAVLGEIRRKGMEFKTSICTATLYSYIRKGVFLRLTCKDLLRRGKMKQMYHRVRPSRAPRGESIENRPPEVSERKTFGHWEMDTVVGRRGCKSVLLVLTERLTRQEIAVKLRDKTAASCVAALDRLERKHGRRMFRQIFKTITVDNGCEFADCAGIEQSCMAKSKRTALYYCHPYSSSERGSNENQNAMLRRFFPKGTNFDKVKNAQIQRCVTWMNEYPRAILGFQSSNDLYRACVAQIGG